MRTTLDLAPRVTGRREDILRQPSQVLLYFADQTVCLTVHQQQGKTLKYYVILFNIGFLKYTIRFNIG